MARRLLLALSFAALAACGKSEPPPLPECASSATPVYCLDGGACPAEMACVGNGLCAPTCTECTCDGARHCEFLPLYCGAGACPFYETDYCVAPNSAWFDAGPPSDGSLSCTGPVDCMNVPSGCASTWSQAEAGACSWGNTHAYTCDGLIVVNAPAVDTGQTGYFLADSGALLAVVTVSTTSTQAQCNEGVTSFVPPSCANPIDLVPDCDGGRTSDACSGPADCFFNPGSGCEIATWSDVRALPCGWQPGPGPVTTGACGGYDVINVVGADDGQTGYFDPDSGALVAVVQTSTAGSTTLCNTPSSTFDPPSCAALGPLPSCNLTDGGALDAG